MIALVKANAEKFWLAKKKNAYKPKHTELRV